MFRLLLNCVFLNLWWEFFYFFFFHWIWEWFSMMTFFKNLNWVLQWLLWKFPFPYKTIEPQGIERGRTLTRISSISKYGGGAQAASNFRGRKSNSLMNLCGGKNYPNFHEFNFNFFNFFEFIFVQWVFRFWNNFTEKKWEKYYLT